LTVRGLRPRLQVLVCDASAHARSLIVWRAYGQGQQQERGVDWRFRDADVVSMHWRAGPPAPPQYLVGSIPIMSFTASRSRCLQP
jgi:hypothetical protein